MERKEIFLKNSPFAELNASDGSARIRIYTYRYEIPNATNKDDADWHMNYITLFVNGVHAEIDDPIIDGKSLEKRLTDIIKLINLQSAEVDFSFMEPEFGFEIKNESLSTKDILIKGELIDAKLNGSDVHIHFEFKCDLQHIQSFADGIREILEKYPSRYSLFSN